MSEIIEFIRKSPKAELHLHIEGTLEPDRPEVTGNSGEAAEEQPAAVAAEPEGEDAAPMALNVSVASGAVTTPTGAAVVATEPVREERADSLPDFSEEESNIRRKWGGR